MRSAGLLGRTNSAQLGSSPPPSSPRIPSVTYVLYAASSESRL